MTIQPLYGVAGLLVGLLVGLTGVGGGSLMTPLLVLMFGFHPSVAVGTDLLYASVTKSVGSLVHGIRGSVDWRIVGRLAAGSVPAALACLWLLARLGHPSDEAEAIIKLVLGVVLVLTSIVLLFRDRLALWSRSHARARSETFTAGMTILLGLVIGIAVSLSSVGAGAIGATALIFLYPRLPIGRIVGADIAHAVPLTLIAGFGHWLLGSVDVSLLLSLLVGSIPGIILGSMMSSRTSDHVLRPALAVTLALVGMLLLR
jgi:uncharacterized membrane protein YfcA